MRKQKVFLAVVLVCLLPLTMVSAQRTAGSFSIGGFGGIGLPMGPEGFKDYFNMGIGFGGKVKFNFTEMTGISASFTYQPFKIDMDIVTDVFAAAAGAIPGMEVDITGGNPKVYIIAAHLVQYITAPDAAVGLYLKAGGGMYRFGFDDVTVKMTYMGSTVETTEEIGVSENKMGFNGGLGFEMSMSSNMWLFFEGLFHYVFTEVEKTSFITAMAGISISP